MSSTTAGPIMETGAGEQRRVVFASSLGTVFEWYDFYLYATLAPFFAGLFFPKGNDTAALLSAFATYAAGFVVRPFGALIFGRVGDLVGRKYTFLVTIVIMGISTAGTGLLPTYAKVGILAPILLVSLRLLQGLALGGEYGGAATYVAEHSAHGERGRKTAWIQTTATLGLFMSLLVIGICRWKMTPDAFKEWGWRIPFLLSIILLVFSVYIRLKLNESPVFRRMKGEGRGSKAPLKDAFTNWKNLKIVLLSLFGATAPEGVVWYTGQFYALFFLTIYLHVDYLTAYILIAISLVLGTPFFIWFGALSDKIGRKGIMLAGFLLAAVTYFPLFKALTHNVNPALESFAKKTPISIASSGCRLHIFVLPGTKFSDCDKATDFITKQGLSYTKLPEVPGQTVVTKIGDIELQGWNEDKYKAALAANAAPKFDKTQINWVMSIIILFILVIYVTLVYAPIAAFLVELFPTRIRYTSMSFPYHIGNGWFGGLLPLLATAIVAKSGNIYAGLWYPIIVAIVGFVIGLAFLPETKDVDIVNT
jgi:MFS family permease